MLKAVVNNIYINNFFAQIDQVKVYNLQEYL